MIYLSKLHYHLLKEVKNPKDLRFFGIKDECD